MSETAYAVEAPRYRDEANAPSPGVMSHVAQEQERLSQSVKGLFEAVAALEERLDLYLRPENPAPEGAVLRDTEPRVHAAKRIADETDTIVASTQRLLRLRDRFEG